VEKLDTVLANAQIVHDTFLFRNGWDGSKAGYLVAT